MAYVTLMGNIPTVAQNVQGGSVRVRNRARPATRGPGPKWYHRVFGPLLGVMSTSAAPAPPAPPANPRPTSGVVWPRGK